MVLTSFFKSSFSLLFSLEKNIITSVSLMMKKIFFMQHLFLNIISFLVNTFNLVVENHTHHYIMKIANQNLVIAAWLDLLIYYYLRPVFNIKNLNNRCQHFEILFLTE